MCICDKSVKFREFYMAFFFKKKKLVLIREIGDCLALNFPQKQCMLTAILLAVRQGEPASGFK